MGAQVFKLAFVVFVALTLFANVIILIASTKDKPPDLVSIDFGSTFATTVSLSSKSQPIIRVVRHSQKTIDEQIGNTVKFDIDEGYKQQNLVLSSSSSLSNKQNGEYNKKTDISHKLHDDKQVVTTKEKKRKNSEHSGNGTAEKIKGNNLLAFKQQETRWLSISVKSSKSHVLVVVNGSKIYESKADSDQNQSVQHSNHSLPTKKRVDGQNKSSSSGKIIVDSNSSWRVKRAKPTKHLALRKRRELTTTTTVSSPNATKTINYGRGLHVLVLSQFDGRVLAKRVFDTYVSQQDEELNLFLRLIKCHRIVVMAIQDEASLQMPIKSPARKTISEIFASHHINKLSWRHMWALVAKKQCQKIDTINDLVTNFGEALTASSAPSDWAPPALVDTKVPLVGDGSEVIECKWTSGNHEENLRRQDFCSNVEGYGAVCDCDSPSKITFEETQIQNSAVDNVPIIVMASNRPTYLFRMLSSLLSARGVSLSRIVVFIDGYFDEPLKVTRLLNVKAIQSESVGAFGNSRISHHYKSSLTRAFEMFPNANNVLIFEEDLDISQDALLYFNSTISLLEKSNSNLYCISAWNDQGYEHSTKDTSLVYRVESMPGLGWLLSRSLFENELAPLWPDPSHAHDWDMWIRTDGIRKGRECLVPAVSRTYHFGARGINMNSYFQRKYFSKHAFVSSRELGNTNILTQALQKQLIRLSSKETYDEMIASIIKSGHVVFANNLTKNETISHLTTEAICSLATTTPATNLFERWIDLNHNKTTTSVSEVTDNEELVNSIPATVRKSNVIFIEMIDKRDYKTWLKIAKCWHIWDLDVRGQHNAMWRLFLNEKHTLVIGYPASSYSYLKPANVVPLKFK